MARGHPFGVLSLMTLGLVVTNAFIWTLLALTVTHWSSKSISPQWVINHRSSLAIGVQVIAQVLGMIVVTVFCNILNLSTRAKLTYGSYSLESLSMLNAICAPRADWSLRFPRLLLLLLFLGSSFAPAALWAGAITPLIANIEERAEIAIPRYRNLTYGIVSPSGLADESLTNITAQGTFTYRPELTLQGLILDNTRQASSADGAPITQSKMDNINYRYRGRTYGTGASVGLRTRHIVDSLVQGYKYSEPGLQITSSCIYNDSSASFFDDITPDGFTLQIYNAVFQTPNRDDQWYIASAGQRDWQILSLSASSGKGGISENLTHYTTMMTPAGRSGKQYGLLDQIQCEIKYEPTTFDVTVNVTNTTIMVTPTGPADLALFPNYTDLTPAITHRLYNIGQLFSSTQWGSPMGDALMNNVNNLAFARNDTEITNSTILEAVGDSMNSMLDSIVEALAGSQLMMIDDSSQQPITITKSAVVFGEKVYIYTTAAINAIITILFLVELVRTGAWRLTPKFDFMNVQDLVLAASAGGTVIAKDAAALSTNVSKGVGDIRIRLKEGGDEVDMLVSAHGTDEDRGIDLSRAMSFGRTFQASSRGQYTQI